MTKEETIKILNVIIYIIPKEYCNEETEGVIEMAIKSLEAWEKVEKEIDDSILICRKDAQNNNWCDGELAGFLQCKDIIDRNLSEVSE